MRLVVAITGASGVIYGVRFLEACREHDISTELIVSEKAEILLQEELGKSRGEVEALADVAYRPDDVRAPIASGSQVRDGMVIVPCSMGTLGKIAGGIADNLIVRAADVYLKQRRPLVLVIRESPLSLVHLSNMERVACAGAVILPAAPAFYHKPSKISELVDFVVGKIFDVLGVEHELYSRWGDQTSRAPVKRGEPYRV